MKLEISLKTFSIAGSHAALYYSMKIIKGCTFLSHAT